MDIKKYLTAEFEKAFEKLGFDKALASVGFSARPELCDFQNNAAFALSKVFKKPPIEIATQIANSVKIDGFCISVCPPAFVNISISNEKLSELANTLLTSDDLLIEKTKKTKNILIDYGGANIAKELHMGHLRSPIIGESLKRLYRLLGHNVVSDTHLGDWGLQIGLTIAQLEENGILDFWFKKTGERPIITLDMLNEAYPKASDRKNKEPAFKKKADDFTLFVQQKKEPFFEIYQEIRNCSISKIKQNYADLNCFFDLWLGESHASPYIDETIKIFKEQGLSRMSEGALVVDVALPGEQIPIPKKNPDDPTEEQRHKNPMPPAILKKHNDGYLYATTDLATILMRNEENNFDEIHYVTDDRQIQHFKQVFRCAKMSGISPATQALEHIWFGKMNGPDGKPFKTRAGGVIKLDDVVKLLTKAARDKLEQNDIFFDDSLALQIGVAALKFGDLSNVVTKDYVFDLDKFLLFEGKTGPYLQYTATRINSLLSKTTEITGQIKIRAADEKAIIMNLIKLLSCFETCFAEKSLHTLCLGTYNLASSYSSLYSSVRILTEKSLPKRQSLISLSKLVLRALELALNILGIEIPERM